jgi:molybdate transport system ATP-binding protein
MEQQKIIAIVGHNGSGKTLYVNELRKKMSSDRVRYIAFCDSYGTSTDRAYYLQLRWNQHDIDKETPCVGEMIQHTYALTGNDSPERRQLLQNLYKLFQFEPLLDKYIISLSSGELRKFQLIKTLLAKPNTLILDNPFIGLDAETRKQLNELFPILAKEQQMNIYLVVARKENIPDYVDDIIWITPQEDYLAPLHHLDENRRDAILSLGNEQQQVNDEIVCFNHVSIRYDNRTILHDVNWTIRQGECWALSGPNGSGKSTLLSLICADNPQSYACDITLFDRPRGTGESIWDIKKHIGYVSPEMHRSYKRNLPAIRIVASGLMDSIGLYAVPNGQDYDRCHWWMNIFGIGQLADKPFLQLSSGEQRLVLLARAFVKDPQLLILDEPLHGLDLWNRRLVKDIIETFCQRRNKTMIMVTHYQTELPNNITHQKFLARNL